MASEITKEKLFEVIIANFRDIQRDIEEVGKILDNCEMENMTLIHVKSSLAEIEVIREAILKYRKKLQK